jgi:DNA polymerase-4
MFRVICHLDMDAFYASIEQRDNPALRGKPLIVGAPPTQRGVVAACSYEARKFGVRSALPSSVAKRLCPAAIFVPPRMHVYRAESVEIMKLVEETSSLIEQVSIDEAYIDLSAACQAGDADASLGLAMPLAFEIKRKIFSERRLTTSIGIGANKFLAKVASDFQKPNGLTIITEAEKVAFLRPLSVRAIHGVGKVTEEVLNKAGIHTIADLQDFPGNLRELVGSFAESLKGFAFGEDDRPLEIDAPAKSISSETTFLHDTDDRKVLRQCLREQAAEIAEKLKRNQLAAQTVQVKIRYGDFTTLTRQFSVEEFIIEAEDIYRLACHLLAREKLVSRPLRLIGVGVSGLSTGVNSQLELPLKAARIS